VIWPAGTTGALRSSELCRTRRDFQMIFQDPYASLNPRMTVFDALAEAIRSHRKVPRVELRPVSSRSWARSAFCPMR
jgi:ABC-type glutathione transport system ATPase component